MQSESKKKSIKIKQMQKKSIALAMLAAKTKRDYSVAKRITV